MNKKLWTHDFTILTLGTVVNMFGNAISGFAMGLLVLDYTNSTLLYSVYLVFNNLPRVVMPLIAGPYLDRFSRKRIIYLLNFFAAGIYLAVSLLVGRGLLSYPLILAFTMLVGTVDSVYSVAYDSFYPMLISEGNFSKAYSISSLIYPLATTIMVPIAGVAYGTVGITPLFVFNAATFFLAALFQTRIRAKEAHMGEAPQKGFSAGRYAEDFKAGLAYLRSEKGLFTITVYFCVSTLVSGAAGALLLPFFKSHTFAVPESLSFLLRFVKTEGGLGVGIYSLVMSVATFGRLIGGAVHYRFHYPVDKKFYIALFVYTSLCFVEGGYLYLPVAAMLILELCSGALAVTSFNIRISATQNYVKDEFRGRFNGIFSMVNIIGMIVGQLLAGGLSAVMQPRAIISLVYVLNLVAIYFIMYRNREHVKRIYNRQV
ncbi:MAG: MFS transporter [Clostridiaceae bacterium]|nr:MFS transporter [Eubacteriales bacterium]